VIWENRTHAPGRNPVGPDRLSGEEWSRDRLKASTPR